jgi:hypothetical protein
MNPQNIAALNLDVKILLIAIIVALIANAIAKMMMRILNDRL